MLSCADAAAPPAQQRVVATVGGGDVRRFKELEEAVRRPVPAPIRDVVAELTQPRAGFEQRVGLGAPAAPQVVEPRFDELVAAERGHGG